MAAAVVKVKTLRPHCASGRTLTENVRGGESLTHFLKLNYVAVTVHTPHYTKNLHRCHSETSFQIVTNAFDKRLETASDSLTFQRP